MNMSTITQKGQATIPAEVRKKLDLHPGDKIGFELKDGNIVLRKIQAFEYEYHKALGTTLSEWSSVEDDDAYGDL
ncbi:MAG: AbrB/MazE/SpoVT family DNA-binding domain-containing protein [Gammaproteobacteria bacterium]|nr:AbrB/MazE/SpoVT family DNA-binding domain-containing protein [Gammaproteobacteria bacterium]